MHDMKIQLADYLIVGGGVAGTTAAEVLRQRDASADIHIVTAEPHPSYSRMMLSKPDFFLGKIPIDAVYMKPKNWFQDHRIKTSLGDPVMSLDVAKRQVKTRGGQVFKYKKLLLSHGTAACVWDVPGAEKKNVLHLRTLDDALELIQDVKQAKRAAIIGGGFIGFEMCDTLRKAGIETTLVLRESYFWEPLLDREMGQRIEQGMRNMGVNVLHQASVEEVLGQDAVEGLRLSSGATIPCDLVLVGIGTKCSLDWVRAAGIKCNRGILANEFLETSAKSVWVAGDVAEYQDEILEETIQLGSWVNAHEQGLVAADNMAGHRRSFHAVSFFSSTGAGVNLSFVGDVRAVEGRQVIDRGAKDGGAYTRIILLNDEVEGATMLNRAEDLEPLRRLIENNQKVGSHVRELADPTFDLRRLLTS